MAKPQTIHLHQLDWKTPEWADDKSEALVAYADGYELEIGLDPEQKKKWDWAVKMTAEISETPEIVAAGTAASPNGAKIRTVETMNASRRSRAKAKTDEPRPEAPTVSKTAGEMLEAVEAQVAAEAEVKPAKKPARKAVTA